MINKFFSNLALNPSMIDRVSFYAKRLRQEESVRRIGLILVVCSMVLQFFIALSPPERSLAVSDNHIINGIRTRNDILSAWDRPGSDIPQIYAKFGVSRDDILALPQQPNVTIRSNAADYWSIGRNSLSGYTNVQQQYKSQEIALATDSVPIYIRPLKAWDINNSSNSYKAFQGKKKNGQLYWILVDCGNYTQIGKPQSSPPSLEVQKSIVGGPKQVKEGDQITYRIEYRNKTPDSLANNVIIEDQLNLYVFDIVAPRGLQTTNGLLRYPVGNLAYSSNFKVFDLTLKVSNKPRSENTVCNTTRLSADNASPVTGGGSPGTCVEFPKQTATPKPSTPGTPPTTPTPQSPTPTLTPIPTPNIITTSSTTIPLGQKKTVKSVTRDITLSGADTVNPGEILEYFLTTTNSQNVDQKNIIIEDYVGDLLDYSDIDVAQLASSQGVFDRPTKKIIWKNQTIKANSQTTLSFRVTIKDPIPKTNSPSRLTTSFDCKISNKYGDEITLGIACPLVKEIEKLPNTGPGTTISIMFGISVVGGYFLERSRLFYKELNVIRKNNVVTGGM